MLINTATEEVQPETLAKETRAKMLQLFNEGASMDMVYSMLQQTIDKLSKNKLYTTKLKIDFSNNYHVEIEFTPNKPTTWSAAYIRDFLKKLGDLLGQNKILMYSFTLRYNQPIIIELGEVPNNRFTAYCFTKPNGKITKGDPE